MGNKAEQIEKLEEDIQLLIESNMDIVKQLSGALRREAAMEERLDKLLRDYARLDAKVNRMQRKLNGIVV